MSWPLLRALGKVGWYALLPLWLWVIPTTWLESRRRLCPIYNLFGVSCPGCGIVRAVSSAFHADLRGAVRYNARVIIVLPLLSYLWARRTRASVLEVKRALANSHS
ncbi:MAG: DUF2752 domain-containing protein [Chloroflexota bacterium]|nr:DUF2752 domain-containing protein [Chloroflexota bacterium]